MPTVGTVKANDPIGLRETRIPLKLFASVGADAFTLVEDWASLTRKWESAVANGNTKTCRLLAIVDLEGEQVLTGQFDNGVSGQEHLNLVVAGALSSVPATSAQLSATCFVLEGGAKKTSVGTAGELIATAPKNLVSAGTARTEHVFQINGSNGASPNPVQWIHEEDKLAIGIEVVLNDGGGGTNRKFTIDDIYLSHWTHG